MSIGLDLGGGLQRFPVSALSITVLLGGILLAFAIAQLVVGVPMQRLWGRYITDGYQRHTPLVWCLSFMELALYVGSILVGQPAFIAVWLGIKLAGEWVPHRDGHDRAMYHLFLIGSAGNLLLSVVAGIVLVNVLSRIQ